MLNFRKVFILPFLLIPFSSLATEINSLYGTWGHSDDDGKSFWGYEKVTANGVISWGVIPETGEEYTFESSLTFDKKNNEICFQITKSADPYMPVGERFCNTLIKLTETELHYLNQSKQPRVMYKR